MALLVASINVERDNHLSTVQQFLAHEKPEVVCLQEVYEEHIELFAGSGKFPYAKFTPRNLYNDGGLHVMGLAILSRYAVDDMHTYVHRGDLHELQVFDESSLEAKDITQNLISPFVTVTKERKEYRIGTMHFTWTPDGMPDFYQRRDLKTILRDLEFETDCAYIGDFNAPRGGEIFSELSKHFIDNIPPEYETSIDVPRHRLAATKARELSKNMVDGFFTRGAYEAQDVRLISGVSDHMALLGNLKI